MKEPRINVYVCAVGHLTVTVDVDDGVTPFMMGCKHDGCKLSATSSFYPRGPKPANIPEPQWEWFKPTRKELIKKYKDREDGVLEAMIDHFEQGGLDLRKRTDREPVYYHT